jgi:hypothetical protein
VFDERFEVAAQRILAGDESVQAARQLEGVLLDDYPGEERFDDLLEALALYAPGGARGHHTSGHTGSRRRSEER